MPACHNVVRIHVRILVCIHVPCCFALYSKRFSGLKVLSSFFPSEKSCVGCSWIVCCLSTSYLVVFTYIHMSTQTLLAPHMPYNYPGENTANRDVYSTQIQRLLGKHSCKPVHRFVSITQSTTTSKMLGFLHPLSLSKFMHTSCITISSPYGMMTFNIIG